MHPEQIENQMGVVQDLAGRVRTDSPIEKLRLIMHLVVKIRHSVLDTVVPQLIWTQI